MEGYLLGFWDAGGLGCLGWNVDMATRRISETAVGLAEDEHACVAVR